MFVMEPIIRQQLAAQYREWNRARDKSRGFLTCNRCKELFPRDAMIRVHPSGSRFWNSYCPDCYLKRKPRRTSVE
jgi:hypothetical protein